jgi:CubicO group peptidase (beta-lactamase class C family)
VRVELRLELPVGLRLGVDLSDIEIQGRCDERFASVRSAFEENFRLDLELGASFAVAIEGEFLVDLWAGHADLARTRPWQPDTITAVYSSAKIVTALCGLMILDRGLIELDAPVARYWPEFAAAGKAAIPVRQLFCHASGVAGLDPPIHLADLTDWDRYTSKLAAQAPWWEPGTVSGYHGPTFSVLIGELVRRTTGLTPERFLAEEVSGPIDADFRFGLRDSDLDRLAEPELGEKRATDEGSFMRRTAGAVTEVMPLDHPGWRACPANGYGNARSLVKLGSILANGGSLGGHRFMSSETARLAYQEQIYTKDLVFEMPVRFGLGFGLASKEFPLPFENAFHWGGFGGSSVIMEPASRACWSYVPNRLEGATIIDPRGTRLIAAAATSLLALES